MYNFCDDPFVYYSFNERYLSLVLTYRIALRHKFECIERPISQYGWNCKLDSWTERMISRIWKNQDLRLKSVLSQTFKKWAGERRQPTFGAYLPQRRPQVRRWEHSTVFILITKIQVKNYRLKNCDIIVAYCTISQFSNGIPQPTICRLRDLIMWGHFRRGSGSRLFPDVQYRRCHIFVALETPHERMSRARAVCNFPHKSPPSKYSTVECLHWSRSFHRHERIPPFLPPSIHRASKIQRAIGHVIQEAGVAAKSLYRISCTRPIPRGH